MSIVRFRLELQSFDIFTKIITTKLKFIYCINITCSMFILSRRAERVFSEDFSYVANKTSRINAATSRLRRCARANVRQQKMLVDYMLQHKEFAVGKIIGTNRAQQAQQWHRLMELLNRAGPAKTVIQWQKVWTSLKSKVRSKIFMKRRQQIPVENQQLCGELSSWEVKVKQLIRPRSADESLEIEIDNDAVVNVSKANSSCTEDETNLDITDYNIQNYIPPTNKRKESCSDSSSTRQPDQENLLQAAEHLLTSKEEDWEIEGRAIGVQLKDVSKRQLVIARKLISDVIYYASLEKLSEQSTIVE